MPRDQGGQGRKTQEFHFSQFGSKIDILRPGRASLSKLNDSWIIEMKKIVVLFALLLNFGTSSSAGELKVLTNTFCDWEFSGVIEKGDAEKIRQIPWSMRGLSLCLNSPGGSLSEGLAMFEAIWAKNLTTAVMPGARCESACAVAYLGGSLVDQGTDLTRHVERTLWLGGKLGFHGPGLNLANGQTYTNDDVGKAFQIAIATSARLFEINRVQDRGSRAMTDHLYHRWLKTAPSSMYFIETVGDAILSDLSIGGIDYNFQIRPEHIRNVCDNLLLKGGYPSGGGQTPTIHSEFSGTAQVKEAHYLEDMTEASESVLMTVKNGYLSAYGGSYSSDTKYYLNGCVVSFSVETIANFSRDRALSTGEEHPIQVAIFKQGEDIDSDVRDVFWPDSEDVLLEQYVSPIYLLPFEKELNSLPKHSEHERALAPSTREVNPDRPELYFIEHRNRDLPGGDIDVINIAKRDDVSNPDECLSLCLNNKACLGVTVDNWNNFCFLKGAGSLHSQFKIQPRSSTYLRPQIAWDVSQDTSQPVMKHRRGKGFDSYPQETQSAMSYEKCAGQCLKEDFCVAVNFKAAEKSCELFADTTPYISMADVEMGLKVHAD